MMKGTFTAIVIILLHVYSASSSHWFTIVNLSPYHFQLSDVRLDNFDLISNIRPLSVQNLGIRFNATRDLQIVYGNRLKLYLAPDDEGVHLQDIRHDCTISCDYDSGRDTLTIRATDAQVEQFSFIVSSDPQPYRLANDGDPNAQRSLWLESTKPVFERLKAETGIHLIVVNGDLTEFGRSNQWKTFQQAIAGIPTTMALGLGNHDYENNVGDCTDSNPEGDSVNLNAMNESNGNLPSNWFASTPSDIAGPNMEELVDSVKNYFSPANLKRLKNLRAEPDMEKLMGSVKDYFSPAYVKRMKNLCARRMVDRMRDHVGTIAKLLWDFSSNEQSLAYGWNYGSALRFVQLHNRPNYTVTLKGFLASTVSIKSSKDWLIADMNTYKDRSYIVNVHDAIGLAVVEELRPYYGRIKAIFAGHTHEAGVKCYNGIAIFDSGALFKNEFLRVDFSEGGRCFDVLHFAGNDYVAPLATNYCFQSILDNPCN